MPAVINAVFLILVFVMLITTIWANIKQIQTHKKLDKKIDSMDAEECEPIEIVYPKGTEV